MAYLRVETTTDSVDSATQIARIVVESGAAACGQVSGPITSLYRWEGKVEQAREYLVTFKASAAAYTELEEQILQIHPYEVPEVVAVPITHGHQDYLDWLDDQTGPRR